MKLNFIPLGTRCSSAFVVRDNIKKRELALPFDWLDLSIISICQFVKLNSHEDVIDYVNLYFEKIGEDPHKHEDSDILNYSKHPDGTWFAHEIELIDGAYKLKPGTKNKFIKRLSRLIQILNSDEFCVFLTIMFEEGMYSFEDYETLKNILRSKVKNNAIFITVNLGNEPDFHIENHFNFRIPQLDKFDDGLKGWESLIGERIKTVLPEDGDI